MKKIFCRKCNAELIEQSKFCANCGTEINKSSKNSPINIFAIVGIVALAIILYFALNENKVTNSPVSKTDPHANVTNPEVISTIKTLEEHLKNDPNNLEFILALANSLQDARFFPRAIEMYKKYLSLSPKNANARVDLGICYFESGDTENAISEIKIALKHDKNHQMAMFNLGIINLNIGKIEESKLWFQKTIESNSKTNIAEKAKELLSQHVN